MTNCLALHIPRILPYVPLMQLATIFLSSLTRLTQRRCVASIVDYQARFAANGPMVTGTERPHYPFARYSNAEHLDARRVAVLPNHHQRPRAGSAGLYLRLIVSIVYANR